jgi:Mg-chelatase subunit ChlD
MADQKYPGDPEGRTYAQLIAEGQCKAAIKGKTEAAREIADRLEGKAVQPVVGDITGGMSVTLNIEVVRKKLFGDDE